MTTSLARPAALALAGSALLAGSLVPAAQADPPPPASNDLVLESTFGSGQLGFPAGVERSADGHVWVADPTSGVVREFTAAGTLVNSFNGADSGKAFQAPSDVDSDAAGNIYVADSQNARVVKLDSTGAFVDAFDGSDSPGHTLQMDQGLGVRGATVYVADTGADRVETFTTGGAFKSAIGSSGDGNGELSAPYDAAGANDGSVAVADLGNSRIEVFNADGTYRRQFGTLGSGPGQFSGPTGVALDGDGNVLVADEGNDRDQKFSPAGDFLDIFGASADPSPWNVGWDGDQGVYSADTGFVAPSRISHWAPRAEATEADTITSTSATLRGIVRPDGTPTAYQFRWHRAGHGAWHGLFNGTVAGSGNVDVSDALPGLAAHRDYVFRIRIQPGSGGPEITNDVTFTTDSAPAPVAGDIGSPDVSFTGNSARLTVPITGHGGPSTVKLTYQRDGGPEHVSTMRSGDPLTATQRTFAKTFKVQPGAHYSYEISLSNNAGGPVTMGGEFTTP